MNVLFHLKVLQCCGPTVLAWFSGYQCEKQFLPQVLSNKKSLLHPRQTFTIRKYYTIHTSKYTIETKVNNNYVSNHISYSI